MTDNSGEQNHSLPGQDWDEDDPFVDNVRSGTTKDIEKQLSTEQQKAMSEVLDAFFSPNHRIALNTDELRAQLPREALESICLDGLANTHDVSKFKEILGGTENLITSPLVRGLALDEAVSFYLGYGDYQGMTDFSWFKKLTGITDEEIRPKVIEGLVSGFFFGDEYYDTGSLISHLEATHGEQLGITEEDLAAEASRQAVQKVGEGDINRALELAAGVKLNHYAWQKIGEDVHHLKPIQFMKFLGSRIEHDSSGIYEHFKDEIIDGLDKDADLAEFFVEHSWKYKDEPWFKDAITKTVNFKSAANKLNELMVFEGWSVPWDDELKVLTGFADYADEEAGSYGHARGSETFTDIDSMAEHPNWYTPEQRKLASEVYSSLVGNPTILSQSEKELVRQTRERVDACLDDLEERLSRLGAPEIDRKFIKSDNVANVKLLPFRNSLLRLVSRYIAQTSVANSAIDPDEIGNLLQEGIGKWVDAYAIELPLYDKVYEQFDQMRREGDAISEIYLGRDGIYAYLGRRAQTATRNAKTSDQEPIKLNYLVYPRHYRDSMSSDTKREYIEHEGLSERSNPHFYDTGFTGTIPEDIMQIMGFSHDEIERRIHLLSANRPGRRVRGLDETSRTYIVSNIEYNVKPTETSHAIYKHPTTGKIRPLEEPTTPREQFLYLFLRQAFVRHYYLKEKLLQQQRSGQQVLQAQAA